MLEYEPIIAKSLVIEFAIVGLAVILQHTPLSVMVEFPLLVMFPPEIAVVFVMEETGLVIMLGKFKLARVVNEISEPYEVPRLLVA